MPIIPIQMPPKIIRLRLSDKCNLNCSYCNEHSNGKSQSLNNMYNLINNIKLLSKYENRKIDLFIYGGEPTGIKWFKELIKELQNLKLENFVNNIEIHTNLTYDLTYDISYDLSNTTIASSYHIETPIKLKEIFWKNLEYLKTKNITISEINVMVKDLKDINELEKIVKKLKEENLNGFLIPTFQLLEKYGHSKLCKIFPVLNLKTTDIYEWGKVNFGLIQEKYNPNGLYCNCPIDSFMIDYNGVIRTCQEDYHTKQILKELEYFNFFENTITLKEVFILNKPTLCRHQRCRCEYDILKYKGIK